jgi:hypothetical protein
MYTVVSEDVFSDAVYLSVRGMGEWREMIDREQYRRNLFDGLDEAASVDRDGALIVADRPAPVDLDAVPSVTWLRAVGIDKSTPYRGIAVTSGDDLEGLAGIPDLAIYRPLVAAQRKPVGQEPR